MFKLQFGSDPNTHLLALNHLAINPTMRANISLASEATNFFKWAAHPNKSFGRMLVSEKSLVTKLASTTDLTCTLILDDGTTTKTFSSVVIDNIRVYAHPPISSLTDLGDRILELSFHLDRMFDSESFFGDQDAIYSGTFSSWAELKSSLFNGDTTDLKSPYTFNKYINYTNVSFSELCAIVANSQFLVAYPYHTESTKARITSEVFDPSTIPEARLIHSNMGTTMQAIDLHIKFPKPEYRFGVLEFNQASSTHFTDDDPTNTLARISATLLSPKTLSYNYAFDLLSDDAGLISSYIDSYHTHVSQFMVDRFASTLTLIVQGVYDQDICLNVHDITYAYTSKGFVTTLKSIPWSIPSVQLLDQSTNDVLFVAELLDDMSIPIVDANIYHPLNLATVIDQSVVYDPLELVTNYCAGTLCYVIRTYHGEYVIVSGKCPPKGPCQSTSSSSSSSRAAEIAGPP